MTPAEPFMGDLPTGGRSGVKRIDTGWGESGMNEVKHFELGRVFAANIVGAMDKLGPGVVSLKPAPVQPRKDKIWFEYVREGE